MGCPCGLGAARACDDGVADDGEQHGAPCRRRGGRVLSIVGTPIGNLGVSYPRAAQAFRDADVICCEDTRVTSKLLAYLGISKPLVRCDENVIARRAPELRGSAARR